MPPDSRSQPAARAPADRRLRRAIPPAPGGFRCDLAAGCPGSRTSSSPASSSPTRQVLPPAGFESVDLVPAQSTARTRSSLAGNVTVRTLRTGRDRPVHQRAGRPAEDHRQHLPEEPVLHPLARGGQPIRTPRTSWASARHPGRHEPADLRRVPQGQRHRSGVDHPGGRAVRTDAADREVRRRLRCLPHERAVHREGGGSHPHAAFADNGLPLTAETFTVLQETIDNDRDVLKAFLAAEIRGWNDAVADPRVRRRWPWRPTGRTSVSTPRRDRQAITENALVASDDAKANIASPSPTRSSGRSSWRWARSASRSPRRTCSTCRCSTRYRGAPRAGAAA